MKRALPGEVFPATPAQKKKRETAYEREFHTLNQFLGFSTDCSHKHFQSAAAPNLFATFGLKWHKNQSFLFLFLSPEERNFSLRESNSS